MEVGSVSEMSCDGPKSSERVKFYQHLELAPKKEISFTMSAEKYHSLVDSIRREYSWQRAPSESRCAA